MKTLKSNYNKIYLGNRLITLGSLYSEGLLVNILKSKPILKKISTKPVIID